MAGAVEQAFRGVRDHRAREVRADRRVRDEPPTGEPHRDRSVVGRRVRERRPRALLDRGRDEDLAGHAGPSREHAGRDDGRADREPARHGHEDPEVVPARDDRLGGDPVELALARRPRGGRIRGLAHGA